MSDAPRENRRENRRRGRFGPWLLMSLGLILLLGIGGLMALTGRPLDVPQWAVARVEARADELLAGKALLTMGSAEVFIDQGYVPRIRLINLKLTDPQGGPLADLPEVRVNLSVGALMHWQIQPTSLTLSGASVTLRRNAKGDLDLALGKNMGSEGGKVDTLGGVLAAVDNVLATPLLAGLNRVEANALTLTLDDARAGRTWQVSDGRLTLVQDATTVSMELGFGLSGSGDQPARAVMTFVTNKNSPQARISVRVDDVAAGDIAAQAPALAFLKVVDAPISGTFRAGVNAKGVIGMLEGSLDFGAGEVRPGGATTPIPFEKGSLAFTYDPVDQKVVFSDATVQSAVLRVRASGQAYLRDMENGLPKTLLSQVKFAQVMVDPAGLFQEPVKFSEGAVDMRLRLDPFDLTLGQMSLVEGKRRIEAKGDFRAGAKGWNISLESKLNEISHKELLALWPVGLVPLTREWVQNNVETGVLFNVNAALRLTPGAEPKVSLGYDFTDADVRIIKTLPPIVQGRGYATIEDKTYTMVVDAGHVVAPVGGDIDVAGSVFTVPDIDIKPPPAVVRLKTESSITAALSLLDQPPFQFMTKAGKPVDIAEGHASLTGVIKLPLADKILLPDVSYDVTGTLSGVHSDRIVKGRTISADQLTLTANDTTLTVSGKGTVGVAPFDMTWTQGLAKDQGGSSTVVGTVDLGQKFVDEFHIGLPPGAVSGSAVGQVRLDLSKDAPARFALTSDLVNLGLALPEFGWSKPAAVKGQLVAEGVLSAPPVVNKLEINGPGLSASGKVTLNPNGSLDAVRFQRVKVGDWLDGRVDVLGRGIGHGIALAVRSGSIDLRRATFARSAARKDAVPISLALDKLTISQGMVLTGFHGDFTTLGGFNGNFTALVNGGAPITGTVVPSGTKSAVRIQADDAGAVIADAGIFDRGRGGHMTLTLLPRAEAGQYDGHVAIDNIKVVKAPALADLLEAVSIIGLLDQLNGPGIGFVDTQADFRLTPDAIEVSKGSAVGPSMGITLAGLYDLNTKAFNMQGVISPIYILNGIGSLLTRKGEGLFGFNYTLKGTAAAPRVAVNPLSILTPGMFRDLFRADPPKLTK